MDANTKERLKHLDVDSSKIQDKKTRDDVDFLLGGVEQFAGEIDDLKPGFVLYFRPDIAAIAIPAIFIIAPTNIVVCLGMILHDITSFL